MSSNGRTVIIAVVALIVGAAGGIAFGMMQVDEVTQQLVAASQERDQQQQAADRLRKSNEEAAKKYGRELGKLVNNSPAPAAAAPADPAAATAALAPAPEDASKLADAARALLATRDGFRSSIDALRGSMNSEFDALATELGNPAPDAVKLRQALDSLKQNWPAKEKGMEEATRKLLADLGVLGAAAPKPAAAAPAPAAAPEKK